MFRGYEVANRVGMFYKTCGEHGLVDTSRFLNSRLQKSEDESLAIACRHDTHTSLLAYFPSSSTRVLLPYTELYDRHWLFALLQTDQDLVVYDVDGDVLLGSALQVGRADCQDVLYDVSVPDHTRG